jgi:hypothetical protein
MVLSIRDIQQNDTEHNNKYNATFSTAMLTIMHSIVMLSVGYVQCHLCWGSHTSPLCSMSLCWMSWRPASHIHISLSLSHVSAHTHTHARTLSHTHSRSLSLVSSFVTHNSSPLPPLHLLPSRHINSASFSQKTFRQKTFSRQSYYVPLI